LLLLLLLLLLRSLLLLSLTHLALSRYIDDRDATGRSALHWACERGDSTLAMVLIQSGADASLGDALGWTPLHVACRNNDAAICKIIGSQAKTPGAVLANLRDLYGTTPLMLCVAGKSIASAVELLNSKNFEIDLDATNLWGQTAALLCAQLGQQRNTMWEMLLAAGASVRFVDERRQSCLHYAAQSDNAYLCERVLELEGKEGILPGGAVSLLRQRDVYGLAPLDVAEAQGAKRAAARLREALPKGHDATAAAHWRAAGAFTSG